MQFDHEFGIIFSWRILRMLQRAVSEVFSTLSWLCCILQRSDMISSLTRCFTLQLLCEDQNHLHQWRCWSCINITCKVQLITRETDIVLPLITFTSVVLWKKGKSFCCLIMMKILVWNFKWIKLTHLWNPHEENSLHITTISPLFSSVQSSESVQLYNCTVTVRRNIKTFSPWQTLAMAKWRWQWLEIKYAISCRYFCDKF